MTTITISDVARLAREAVLAHGHGGSVDVGEDTGGPFGAPVGIRVPMTEPGYDAANYEVALCYNEFGGKWDIDGREDAERSEIGPDAVRTVVAELERKRTAAIVDVPDQVSDRFRRRHLLTSIKTHSSRDRLAYVHVGLALRRHVPRIGRVQATTWTEFQSTPIPDDRDVTDAVRHALRDTTPPDADYTDEARQGWTLAADRYGSNCTVSRILGLGSREDEESY